MSVAPNPAPRSVRSVCRPIRMICPAPRRLAASTAHSPTAPSPTTATLTPGPACAVTAAWWPVQNTSVSVISDGSSAESAATGSFTSVPEACGTRTASPWRNGSRGWAR